jgi:hypothetical protein
MTPEEIARAISELIDVAEIKYSEAIVKIQNSLYRRIVAVLKDLEIDSDGYILQSSKNRALIMKAEDIFDEVVKSNVYQKAVAEVVSNVPDIDELNAQYFETVSQAFKPNRNYIKSLQQQVISNVNTYALNEGVIVNVKIPLNQILNQNINSGGSFSGMLKQLETFIQGGEGTDGRLLRYSRTYLTDTLFNYSRAYQQAVTRDLKLEWYLYQGGLTKPGKKSEGSRDFCIDRAGHYFHHKEIEAWAGIDWAGKRQGTTESSIFMFAGGWNCKHSIIPVHVLIVPQEDLNRAIELGFYQKAA